MDATTRAQRIILEKRPSPQRSIAAGGDSRTGWTLALRDAWRALWVSRLVVWTAGLAGVGLLGRDARWPGFDPAGVTAPFGALGDALVGPSARWDTTWYLAIAADGYSEPARSVFFPLYPLLVAVLGAPLELIGPGGNLLAGVAISLGAFFCGLVCVHRLAALDLGPEDARTSVLALALFPTAFAFSAVYTEGLFLALSAGAILAGRTGRWGWAGVLGALAAATRSTGVLLLVPLALLFLYGPRTDRPGAGAATGSRWRPRHRLDRDAVWLLAVPLGLGAYLAYLAAATGDPLAPFEQQAQWFREFAGPFGGAWDGAVAAWDGARQLLSGAREPVYFKPAGGDPFDVAAHNLGNFAFLVFAAVAGVGVLRRLPAAYGAWVFVGVALPLSNPVGPEPLASFPRYIAVLFPLHMWLAAWAREHRARGVTLAVSAVLLAVLSGLFTSWRWVG